MSDCHNVRVDATSHTRNTRISFNFSDIEHLQAKELLAPIQAYTRTGKPRKSVLRLRNRGNRFENISLDVFWL